jgi:hypothetical protein
MEWPAGHAVCGARLSYLDILRPLVWVEDGVEPWMTRNVLVFGRDDQLARQLELDASRSTSSPLPLVHPSIHLSYARRTPKDLVRERVARCCRSSGLFAGPSSR